MALACDALFDAQITATKKCTGAALDEATASHMRERFRASCLNLQALPGSQVTAEHVALCARATTAVQCRDTRTPSACVNVAGALRDGSPCMSALLPLGLHDLAERLPRIACAPPTDRDQSVTRTR